MFFWIGGSFLRLLYEYQILKISLKKHITKKREQDSKASYAAKDDGRTLANISVALVSSSVKRMRSKNSAEPPPTPDLYNSKTLREFPGGPVVTTARFHCQGPGSIPGQGTKIPQATWRAKTNTESLICAKNDM